MNTKVRIQSIDLIKFVAMIAVIGLHTTGLYKEDTILGSCLYKSCVVAIPLFFMVSGYLLLGRNNITYCYAFKKIVNIVRFVFTMSCASFIVYVVQYMLHPEDTNFFNLFIGTFLGAFIQLGVFGIFWYLGTMNIIYFLLPLLNKVYLRRKAFLYTFTMLMIIEVVIFNVNLCYSGGVR